MRCRALSPQPFYTDTDHFLIRTVPTSVPATGAAIEMVSCGEYQVSILIDIILFFFEGRRRTRSHRPDLVRRRRRVIHFERKSRGGLKATPAQARRVETSRDENPKDLTGHDDFVTPARSFVKMTFRHPALVVTAAHRALFVTPQWLRRGRGKQRLILRIDCLHYLLPRIS
jgi:hypothetical protein